MPNKTKRNNKNLERDLDSFSWLPLERWTINNLCGPYLNENIMCKICDKYILINKIEDHLKTHIKQKKAILNKRRLEGIERAKEARRLAREAKKSRIYKGE